MCCLFGILDYKQTLNKKAMNKIVSVLAHECEVRGTDATGISYVSRGQLCVYKRPVSARYLRMKIPTNTHVVMGHTRLTTQGSEKQNYNNHPFRGHVGSTYFSLAHNGILNNDKQLKVSEKLPLTSIKTDSYVAVQLLEKHKALDFESLKSMAEKVEGSFAFTVLDQKNNLYFVKGSSPLCIYNFTNLGFYIYASTEEILDTVIKMLALNQYEYVRVEITGGDILKIDPNGYQRRECFNYEEILHIKHSLPFTGRASFLVDYWNDLKNLAGSFGYSPDDIERFRLLGYPPDAVEEMFYYDDYIYELEENLCYGEL